MTVLPSLSQSSAGSRARVSDTPDELALGPLETLRRLAARCTYSPRGVAAHFGVSQRQLHRLFMTHLKCSPREWLREERMRCALQLLRESNTVKEVAYRLGFLQASQFCRDFRLHFGHPPSAELKGQTARFTELFPGKD
jgi:transcriptional regulator GlxA family with amidase domain